MEIQQKFELRVVRIPGSEEVSLALYQELVTFIKLHDDLDLSVYRAVNTHDDTWVLLFIGEKETFSRSDSQIQQMLSAVHAQPFPLPPESLIPFVERFLARRLEMSEHNETFFEDHHPRA